jgi:malate dehydrogenase (oxaloacetate-decarboxylating)
MSQDVYQKSLILHRQRKGKLGTIALAPVHGQEDLSLLYTPGVAEPCRAIAADVEESFHLTCRGRTVAVISDGSAVLGLGNIGAAASLPVMEGKALLLKEFAGVDAVPIAIDTQEPQEIIKFVRQIAPSFVGINLEDISAPRCFEVEAALQDLGITVFHDDQHGTAIVVTAALHNAARVVKKKFEDLRVVVVGAGAAGLSIANMLLGLELTSNGCQPVSNMPKVADLILVDSKGAICEGRGDLDPYKTCLAQHSNHKQLRGSLAEVIKGVDVVIGVSRAGTISTEMVRSMAPQAIVFAMANPEPEIMPELARKAGAAVVATGRSDFDNQINNVLAFPGVFRAVVDGRLPRITTQMKQAAAQAIASLVPNPTINKIIPAPFDQGVVEAVSQAILQSQSS